MSNTNTCGPAFPTARVNINGVDEQDGIQAFGAGMTLRDYFAAKAMQAFISAYPCQAIDRGDGGIPADHESIAEDAYDMADAMLKAREA
jgi:hypothetical protein